MALFDLNDDLAAAPGRDRRATRSMASRSRRRRYTSRSGRGSRAAARRGGARARRAPPACGHAHVALAAVMRCGDRRAGPRGAPRPRAEKPANERTPVHASSTVRGARRGARFRGVGPAARKGFAMLAIATLAHRRRGAFLGCAPPLRRDRLDGFEQQPAATGNGQFDPALRAAVARCLSGPRLSRRVCSSTSPNGRRRRPLHVARRRPPTADARRPRRPPGAPRCARSPRRGAGAAATGGRGGRVIAVTTLQPDGQRQPRRGAGASGPRIIVFRVSGSSPARCTRDGDVTIAGQTAPGGGITVAGQLISTTGRANIIIRHLRVRPPPQPGNIEGNQYDGVLIYHEPGDLDHVSTRGAWTRPSTSTRPARRRCNGRSSARIVGGHPDGRSTTTG